MLPRTLSSWGASTVSGPCPKTCRASPPCRLSCSPPGSWPPLPPTPQLNALCSCAWHSDPVQQASSYSGGEGAFPSHPRGPGSAELRGGRVLTHKPRTFPPCPRPSPHLSGTRGTARPRDPCLSCPCMWCIFAPQGSSHQGRHHVLTERGPVPQVWTPLWKHASHPKSMELRPGRVRAVLQEGSPRGTEASPQIHNSNQAAQGAFQRRAQTCCGARSGSTRPIQAREG